MSKSAGAVLGEYLAESGNSVKAVTMSYGDVTSVSTSGGDVRLTLSVDGGTLTSVPMTTACRGVKAGDRVIVQRYGHLATVVGVIAHDNEYVDQDSVDDSISSAIAPSSVSLTPNESLLNYSAYTNSSIRIGSTLFLQASIILSTATSWNSDQLRLFTISTTSARPSTERTLSRSCIAICDGGDSVYSRGLVVGTGGNVTFNNLTSGTSGVNVLVIPGVAVRL